MTIAAVEKLREFIDKHYPEGTIGRSAALAVWRELKRLAKEEKGSS